MIHEAWVYEKRVKEKQVTYLSNFLNHIIKDENLLTDEYDMGYPTKNLK